MLEYCANVQGHIGSVVCRQAAVNLTSTCFSQGRSEASLGEVTDTSNSPSSERVRTALMLWDATCANNAKCALTAV